ncbi:helix-turn-helix protein [Saccharothrix australiensis]|uniref:Helix-turn-helix protein n=2 Tax=Saccharothrix australiensis TaxID=2072 RepID=A0A495W453_9PSEU|nr:helix-turn-helix protein [Saccharothrix australiensis]
MSQATLARRAGVSVSLLSKIEIGDRALSQGVAAALGRAMSVTLDEVLGRAQPTPNSEEHLKELRSSIRRFDLPGEASADFALLTRELDELTTLRSNAKLSEVLRKTPGLLANATNHAHAVGTPPAWAIVADIYSAVYWLAARHRWMDLAELAVVKQRLAAERATPLVATVAARDEAGVFLNSGDFEGGLAVVDRAIVEAESTTSGLERTFGVGQLHLRGLTLAGRLGDRAEAERHAAAAWRRAGELPEDVRLHGIHFGPENTAHHLVATSVDLDQHRKALEVADQLNRHPPTLPATRTGPLHLNEARAKLALGDRDGALESLTRAWGSAPQLAKVHPHSQELLRVLISLHRRSNPRLTKLAKSAGVTV